MPELRFRYVNWDLKMKLHAHFLSRSMHLKILQCNSSQLPKINEAIRQKAISLIVDRDRILFAICIFSSSWDNVFAWTSALVQQRLHQTASADEAPAVATRTKVGIEADSILLAFSLFLFSSHNVKQSELISEIAQAARTVRTKWVRLARNLISHQLRAVLHSHKLFWKSVQTIVVYSVV